MYEQDRQVRVLTETARESLKGGSWDNLSETGIWSLGRAKDLSRPQKGTGFAVPVLLHSMFLSIKQKTKWETVTFPVVLRYFPDFLLICYSRGIRSLSCSGCVRLPYIHVLIPGSPLQSFS